MPVLCSLLSFFTYFLSGVSGGRFFSPPLLYSAELIDVLNKAALVQIGRTARAGQTDEL